MGPPTKLWVFVVLVVARRSQMLRVKWMTNPGHQPGSLSLSLSLFNQCSSNKKERSLHSLVCQVFHSMQFYDDI